MSKQVVAIRPDDVERPSGVVEIREAEPPRWWQTTAFRAFAEVRRAFTTSASSARADPSAPA